MYIRMYVCRHLTHIYTFIHMCTPSAVHAQFEAMYLYACTYIIISICIRLFDLTNAKSMCAWRGHGVCADMDIPVS